MYHLKPVIDIIISKDRILYQRFVGTHSHRRGRSLHLKGPILAKKKKNKATAAPL